jgi:hypothetical protein
VSNYKNGVIFNEGCIQTANGAAAGSVTTQLVYANGTTDYFEVYVYQGGTGTTMTVNGASYFTYFSGYLIAPKM